MQNPVYAELVQLLKRAHVLSSVEGLLGWDEQVNLPPDSADLRAEQLALMAELGHAAASDAKVGAALTKLEADAGSLGADEQVVVKRSREDYDRVTKLPADFVREKALHNSKAYHAWAAAREKSDFAAFAPFLAKHLELARREAELMGWGDRVYDYHIDRHDPGMTAARIAALFGELQEGLVPLVREIAESPTRPPADLLKGFPVDAQKAFLQEVTAKLGFNYNRGRIDVSLHPFCSGPGADIRMTTRFDVDNPLDSLFSSIHETGHGLYEQGLPLEMQGTPLGQNAGMAVHESQSRLWENQVSRSREFWKYFEPKLRAAFPVQLANVGSESLYLAINAVEPTLIRVDSDEVHYNLHIVLRFELEKALFAGEISVADLPAAWSEKSQKLLGLTPPDARRGVLQDVHWSGGMFGYFPSYCLGNMIAAQLWAKVHTLFPDLGADFEKGDFSRLLGWLRKEIHGQGRRYNTPELVRKVTGEDLSPRHLLAYLRDRYATLYIV